MFLGHAEYAMKKILIIINNLGIGGAERLVVDDINEMLTRGVSLKLLTLKNEHEASFIRQCKINKNDWTTIPFGNLYNIHSWWTVIRFINSYKPDVVFTHLWYSNTIGRIASKLSGVPKIMSFEHNVYDTLKSKKMFFVDCVLQLFSHKIIAVSDSVKQSLIKHNIKEKRIEVLLNGIDLSKYQNLNIKTLDGEEKKDFTFVFIGRLNHQKGVDILLKAFASVKNSKLIIVGDGAEKEQLAGLSKELKIEERVKFLGVRKDIPKILSYSDCFVLPSRYEGFGIVVLEAMAAGKPIIVSNFAAASEMIKDGYNGIIFPIENIDALAKKMSVIAVEKKQGEYLMKNAQNDSKNFSIQKHTDFLLSL